MVAVRIKGALFVPYKTSAKGRVGLTAFQVALSNDVGWIISGYTIYIRCR